MGRGKYKDMKEIIAFQDKHGNEHKTEKEVILFELKNLVRNHAPKDVKPNADLVADFILKPFI